MNITLQANTGNIITFQSMNNAVTIESRKKGYITLVFNNITNTLAQNCSATIFTITSIYGILHYQTKLHIPYNYKYNQDGPSADDDNNHFGQITCNSTKDNSMNF